MTVGITQPPVATLESASSVLGAGHAPASFSMRVSSKAHYSLRMMTEFAKAYGAGPLSLAEVARTEHLPLPYLEQLAAQLRRGGLVESTRGVRGGYSLARAPGEINVLDIVTCVEGEVAPVDCLAHDYLNGSCIREGDCASRALWQRLKESVDAVLSSTTLHELVADHRIVDTLAPLVAPVTSATEAPHD